MTDLLDSTILHTINGLAEEEEILFAQAGDGGGLSTAERQRLQEIQVQLDQCYDLLRQRQARRAAGLDPNEAEFRPAEVVERYQQ